MTAADGTSHRLTAAYPVTAARVAVASINCLLLHFSWLVMLELHQNNAA